MDFNGCNLRQLLELGLRFPEIGAVNFNIIYLILKTIIKKQGIESLTPNFTFIYESSADSQKTITDKESNEDQKKAQRMEEEIQQLRDTVQILANRISEMDAQYVQKVKKSESEPSTEAELDLKVETKVSDEQKIQELSEGEEDEKETESARTKLAEGKFSWHKGRFFKEKLQDIKKEVESLKESDQKQVRHEMESLQASNDYVVEKFDEVLQDFDTVMNGYSQLGMQIEELDKNVNRKIKYEDDLEKLKEQIDRLEAYVYSGKHEPEDKEERGHDEKEKESEPPAIEEGGPQFAKAEEMKAHQEKAADRKTHFARIVENLMALHEEERAQIVEGPVETEVLKVKPATMKKSYEAFIKATQEIRKEEGALPPPPPEEIEPKDGERAEEIAIEEQAASEIVVREEESERVVREAVQKRFHTAAHAITLVQEMQKAQQAGGLVKAKEKEAFRSSRDRDDGEQQLSAESLEIPEVPPSRLSVEHTRSAPAKATLLFGDDKASRELKERIVLYIKSRLEDVETKLLDKMHAMESSIVELQDENEVLREEMHVLKSRLAAVEANQNKFEGRLTAVEEKAKLNDLHIEEMIVSLDKKADHSDAVLGMTRKDMSILEDRMLEINEATLLNIEELRSFLKDYTVKLRGELEEKVSGFDMDCRLEPLAGRLRLQERMLKDITFKVRVLECQTVGPIEVKRYLHCEDGKRVKPLRRPVSHWTSDASEASALFHDDKRFDEENAEKIEADVQKRLEDALFRDSKRLIGGAHTKVKVART